MATGAPPNYYAILCISETASNQQIREAYKRAALKTHPDRVPIDSPDRATRTRKFQLVNDAYYTLSDASRRREYDAQRKLFGGSKPKPSTGAHTKGGTTPGTFSDDDWEEEFEQAVPPGGSGTQPNNGFYSWAWNYFTGQSNQQNTQQARQQAENEQFGDVFEEMMREEGINEAQNQPKGKLWSIAGGAAGGVLGFIVANFPGAIGGIVAGNRLGAIRDTKGKSVYAVFQDLPYDDRARLLAQLATKVFSHTVGL